MPKKPIQSNEAVPLKLTAAERKLILEGLKCLDRAHEEIIRNTPPGKPVMMTLDTLEDFADYIAGEANHCDSPKQEKKLDALLLKIESVEDRCINKSSEPLPLKQGPDKIAQGMSDLLAGKNPGVMSFQLQPGQKPEETYLLKLTVHQRESLIHCTDVDNKIRGRLKKAGKGAQIVEVTRKELDHLHDEACQAAYYARSPHKQRLAAILQKISDAYAKVNADLFTGNQPGATGSVSQTAGALFQFKITLLGHRPSIWRRIQVQDCTLDKLHEHIQTAMGWTDSHLHQFEIQGKRYGDPELLDDDFDDLDDLDCLDSTSTLVSEILPKAGKRFAFKYEYDFGDSWQHEILFEGCPPLEKGKKYPLCLEGERACPPEDCGGAWGFADYLEALADPEHERHEELLEWDGPFDPNKFDPKQATSRMRKGLPDWREME